MTSERRTVTRARVDQAVAAWLDHAPMPSGVPAERVVAAEVVRQWCAWHLAVMRVRAGVTRGH